MQRRRDRGWKRRRLRGKPRRLARWGRRVDGHVIMRVAVIAVLDGRLRIRLRKRLADGVLLHRTRVLQRMRRRDPGAGKAQDEGGKRRQQSDRTRLIHAYKLAVDAELR